MTNKGQERKKATLDNHMMTKRIKEENLLKEIRETRKVRKSQKTCTEVKDY